MNWLIKMLTVSLILSNFIFIEKAIASERDIAQYHVCYAVFPANGTANYSQIFKAQPNTDFKRLGSRYLAEVIDTYDKSEMKLLLTTLSVTCTDKPSTYALVDEVLWDLQKLFMRKNVFAMETEFEYVK